MIRIIPKITKTLVCLSAVAMVPGAHCQDDIQAIYDNYYKTWYQVEVIIFERVQAPSSDIEVWPKNITLDYPGKLQFLKSEAELQEENELIQQLHEANQDLDVAKTGGLTRENVGSNTAIVDVAVQSQVTQMTPNEKPFVKLDPPSRTLNQEASRLGRNRTMRLLFHEAWRQPFVGQDDSVPIPLSGGDLFENSFELEGTITLHLARYLHINTDLWLTQFETNYGQEPEHWPILPRRPVPPKITLPNEAMSLNDTDMLLNEANPDSETSDTSDWRAGKNPQELNGNISLHDPRSTNFLGDYANLAQKPFIVKQIVKMTQKRRMRSGELHYLDHPRLGLIIRIDPYQAEIPSDENSEG